ncbi:unnamed protein product [Somion occarium]|uniref:Epoxide hydrolase N-terminal domain-containing protein n=1 Tax=Somion occarium TaxID=3059160 RepID=A0ABP1E1S1_9APHY
MAEAPFTLSVPDADLELLRTKLKSTRLPDELVNAKWAYGAPLGDIKQLLERWKDGFDWRAAEAKINDIPQFTRDIEVEGFGTLNIHYIHQKSQVKNAIPLFFSHGWPGHFLEVSKLLPLLTAESPDHPSFHVVAFSLPGFGFSEAPKKRGFRLKQYAEVGHKLMIALGYNEYVVQGGDWGFGIVRNMASLYGGKHIKAWHTNFPMMDKPSFSSHPLLWLRDLFTPYTAQDRLHIERAIYYRTKSYGYFVEQSTMPQTIGYSLADSPVGLLAWVYEKLVNWTDNYPWTDDEVLTWVSIYWFSRAGPAASVRIYYEFQTKEGQADWENIKAPTIPFGVSYFPKEVIFVRFFWTRLLGNLVFKSTPDRGGHFAAHEKPELLSRDIRAMFGSGGPAFGVVPGKDGYSGKWQD